MAAPFPMSFSRVPSQSPTPGAGGATAGTPRDQAMSDGRSPNGKRPRPAESDAQPGQGPGATSAVELTTSVLQLQPAMKSTQDAVHWNCDFLNAMITRGNTLESCTKLVEPQLGPHQGAIAEIKE